MNRLPVRKEPAAPRAVSRPGGTADSLLGRVRRWWDRLLGRGAAQTGEPAPAPSARPWWPWAPPAEVHETARDHVVDIDLPGVRARDVAVEVFGREVRVRGESRTFHTWTGGRATSTETFAHRVVLPGPVDTERVTASLVGGVLRVTAPKRIPARPRRVMAERRRILWPQQRGR